jgi:hypothetical protein
LPGFDDRSTLVQRSHLPHDLQGIIIERVAQAVDVSADLGPPASPRLDGSIESGVFLRRNRCLFYGP